MEKVPIEQSEEGERKEKDKSVWIIDDNLAHIASILRGIKTDPRLDGTEITHFSEGEQAVNQFQILAEDQGQLPNLILMDYELAKEEEEKKFHTGVEVIAVLKEIAEKYEIKLPQIVAFSAGYSDRLLNAGASSSLKKTASLKEIRELLTNI
jgi:CheY-like chemotaxis protein